MLLDEESVPRRCRRGPLERLRVALAHLLHGRVIALGDRRAAIAAMGVFYARTGESGDAHPIDLDAAVSILTARRGEASNAHLARADRTVDRAEESERLLLLAALRVGSAVVHLARDAADVREERAIALRRLDERTLDQRLAALLSG